MIVQTGENVLITVLSCESVLIVISSCENASKAFSNGVNV